MRKSVHVDELKPGMMVTAVIQQSGPMKIRKVGMIRSPDMIKGLKEMGVSVLEVDLDQSLNVEFEGDELAAAVSTHVESNEALSTPPSTPLSTPITATQRLVATNRQVSDVDRQLSQQFHRSLFLPAVDQMPSKWTLYGKPYGNLLLTVSVGLLLGWGVIAGPKLLLAAKEPSMVSSSPANNQAAQETSEQGAAQSLTQDALVADSTTERKQGTQQNTEQSTQKSTQANNSQAQNAALAASTTDPVTSANAKPAPEPIEYESVNGVMLEPGQSVLGYQGGNEQSGNSAENSTQQAPSLAQQLAESQNSIAKDDATEDDAAVVTNAPGFTSSNEAELGFVDNDLLSRIQRAADTVDSGRQQGEQVSQSDIDLEQYLLPPESQQASRPSPSKAQASSDLPRIDQLPPAILTQMPSMSFSAHMNASNAQDRWVRVNGQRLGEGDFIADGLQIKRIESEKVVLEFKQREFTMNALTDW